MVKLSTQVARLYGSHLSIEFHYLLSLFFVRLAAKIPVIADLDRYSDLKHIASATVTDTRSKGSVTGSRISECSIVKTFFAQIEYFVFF